MSRLTLCFARAILIFSVLACMPGNAEARWHGPGHGWGWNYPYAYYPGPYYYATPYSPGPACEWSRVRVWRNGHRTYRRVWRCW